MRYLFSNFSSASASKTTKSDLLKEQLVNAGIVAALAAIATWNGLTPDFVVMLKAFLVTFLFEFRKYLPVPALKSDTPGSAAAPEPLGSPPSQP